MRHELIIRRQALRKQMTYNNDIIKNLKAEMQEIGIFYPEYEGEITKKLEAFEKRYPVMQ